MSLKKALVVGHVAFEDLGSLEPALLEAGYSITKLDGCTADFSALDPCAADLLVVLGGPVGVYEQDSYPFLRRELGVLRERLDAARPTLGICLGAQLMAAALGAQVHAGSRGKEVGWMPVHIGRDSHLLPAIERLCSADLPVLHWHGDTFELPRGAAHLAGSDRYPHQAFSVGDYALGLQFHPEVTAEGLERWYVGHACELAQLNIDVATLRQQSHRHAPHLARAARGFWRDWLSSLGRA
jgi:GMP synthase (glutamine-hydrolysing)